MSELSRLALLAVCALAFVGSASLAGHMQWRQDPVVLASR